MLRLRPVKSIQVKEEKGTEAGCLISSPPLSNVILTQSVVLQWIYGPILVVKSKNPQKSFIKFGCFWSYFVTFTKFQESAINLENNETCKLAIDGLHAKLQAQIQLRIHHPVVTGGRDVEH